MLLEIKNLYFAHRAEQPLFQNFNLKVEKGKIIALVGESGCGKSTLLNIIYGLLQWEKGEIIFNGLPLEGPKGNLVPGEPDMKLVAQNYDLMPYSTVAENVGKFISNIDMATKKKRVLELLELMDLAEYANILPKYLSGGQMQRVAIARALSVLPPLLLLDEPFSNLDYSRKIKLREKLFRFVRKENISLIISTHEIQEIMPWLDQLVVLRDGRLIQNDSAKETYQNPYNDYVAELFGEVNVFSHEEKNQLSLTRKFYYPHQIKIKDGGFKAEVLESRFAGSYYWNKVSLNGKKLIIHSQDELSDLVSLQF